MELWTYGGSRPGRRRMHAADGRGAARRAGRDRAARSGWGPVLLLAQLLPPPRSRDALLRSRAHWCRGAWKDFQFSTRPHDAQRAAQRQNATAATARTTGARRRGALVGWVGVGLPAPARQAATCCGFAGMELRTIRARWVRACRARAGYPVAGSARVRRRNARPLQGTRPCVAWRVRESAPPPLAGLPLPVGRRQSVRRGLTFPTGHISFQMRPLASLKVNTFDHTNIIRVHAHLNLNHLTHLGPITFVGARVYAPLAWRRANVA
jgi:hypothetical protein